MVESQIEEIKRYTGGILDKNDGKFIATDYRIILICFHVLKNGQRCSWKIYENIGYLKN